MGFVIKKGVLKKYIEEEGVTRAVVPEGVKDIHFKAFDFCKKLTSIHIPKSIYADSFNKLILWGSDEVTEITVDDDDPNFTSEGGVLYSKDKTKLIRCPTGIDIERFVVPETVRHISSDAFRGCYKLEEIIVQAPLDCIGVAAFMECTSLKHIEFPRYMNCSFNDDLFLGCHELEEIIIPAGVNSICPNAFEFCDSLKKIVIGKDVYDVDYLSFTAPNLEEIEVDLFNQTYSSKDGILYNNEMTILLFCPYGKSGDVVIPDGVKQIGFDPDMSAFDYCSKLRSVYVPAGVERVYDEAFKKCSAEITYEDRDSIEFFHAERRYV